MAIAASRIQDLLKVLFPFPGMLLPPAIPHPVPQNGIHPPLHLPNQRDKPHPPLTYLTLSLQLQCRIYNQLYNPLCIRTGNKILRERLRGPAMAAYYPRRMATIKDVQMMYPELET